MNLFLTLLRESSLFALQSLVVNRLRTVLSLLGITIGIFAIISVFTMVDTMERNLRSSVRSLGDDVIYVQKWPWGMGSDDYEWWEYLQRPQPSLTEYEQLQERVPQAEAMAFLGTSNRMVEAGNNSVGGARIMAVSYDYEKVKELTFAEGRYFSPSGSKAGRNVAVIGATIASNLFPIDDPLGKSFKIGGHRTTIIGTLTKEGESLIGNSMDDAVLIPVNFARRLFDLREIQSSIMIKSGKNVEQAYLKETTRGAMRSLRRLRPKEEDNFALNEPSLLTSQLEGLFGVLDLAGLIIGGFSILVGGFSIANIMFVSVKERTAMIGIQKALGARNDFILFQFLFESVVLCLVGGLAGLFIVFLGTLGASALLDMEVILSLTNLGRGVGISVIIGIISGFIPAWKASRLDPVDAIRTGG